MDPIHDSALSGIRRLEYELLIRDFIDVLNDGGYEELCPFLHTDVVFRPALHQAVHGSRAVIEMCREIRASFDVFTVIIGAVAVTEDVALVEQVLELELPDSLAYPVMSFASFRFDGYQIIEWRQVHA